MKFGVNKDTQGTSLLPIPAPVKLPAVTAQFKTGYEFPIVRLVAVRFVPNKEITRSGVPQEVAVLEFLFKDKKDRQFTHVEFPIEADDKAEKKIEWLNQRIKHLWDESIGGKHMPADGIGTTATNIAEYYEAIANAFKSVTYTEGEGENAKTRVLHPQTPMYFKVTYNDDRLQMPMFPNFVQRAIDAEGKAVPCETLIINPTYDKVEPKERQKANPAGGFSTGTNAGFGAADMDDFPDV